MSVLPVHPEIAMHRLVVLFLSLSACATSTVQRPQKVFIARDVLTPWQIEKVHAPMRMTQWKGCVRTGYACGV